MIVRTSPDDSQGIRHSETNIEIIERNHLYPLAKCRGWEIAVDESRGQIDIAPPGAGRAIFDNDDLLSRRKIRKRFLEFDTYYLSDGMLDELLGFRHGRTWVEGVLVLCLRALREIEDDVHDAQKGGSP